MIHTINNNPKMTFREFYLMKKNGKKRRICAPSPELLAYQRQLLPSLTTTFLELEFNATGQHIFHGFVKNRNCVTAALRHVGYAHTVCLDISNCFDSIYVRFLHPQVPYIYHPLLSHPDGTLAQGFATSPILANMYLLKPIKLLMDTLDPLFPRFSLTVYADDIQISVPAESYEYLNLIVEFAVQAFNQYGLTINPSKTRIHHAKFGNRRILGIQVGQTSIHPTRKLRKKIRAARHQNNGASLGGLVTQSRLLLPKALR